MNFSLRYFSITSTMVADLSPKAINTKNNITKAFIDKKTAVKDMKLTDEPSLTQRTATN